jgi:hypothetical protein
MKILVSGCSISYGYGFPMTINDPNIWPNLLAKELNAEVNNVSVPGYDNPGIFLNALREFTTNKYDLILIQLSGLDRVVVSPDIHRSLSLGPFVDELSTSNMFIDEIEKRNFFKTFLRINQSFEHWKRLINIIITVQNLVKQGHNIKFLNGLINWTDEFFNNHDSKFARDVVDSHNLPDDDIKKGLDKINLDKDLIDSTLWINLVKCFRQMQVDQASETDNHPGPKSHKIYTDLILTKLNMEKNYDTSRT